MARKAEALTIEEFRVVFDYEAVPKRKCKDVFREECLCTKNTIFNLFPIARWLPRYKFKEYFLGDIMSGITVAVMHIPHGLAYSQLAGVMPVVGLYMAVFPLLVYILMGTSKHLSIGTFAVVCAMVGDIVVEELEKEYDPKTNSTEFEAIEIATSVGLVVGIWQIALSLLRLGTLTVFLSTALVSGFTTGAAVHVLTYQVKNLLGIKVSHFSGPLKLIHIYIDIFSHIQDTHLVTMYISIAFLTFLVVYTYGVKPLIQKKVPKCKIPVPIELFAVVLGILLSYFLEFEEKHGVRIVGSIPKGLPVPRVPPPKLWLRVMIQSFSITIVSISINLSLAKIFSKKLGYEISSQQEILAYGFANFLSSFFQCVPTAASLSRSMIQFTTGCKTLLSGVFTILVMILILLFMAPLFEPVPYCVLSAIVVVTLLGLLLQVRDLPEIMRCSLYDGFVWLITFFAVVIIDIDWGLLIGFVASVFVVVILHHRPQLIYLGYAEYPPPTPTARRPPAPGTSGLYLDTKYYRSATKLPNVCIVRIIGGLTYANEPYMHARFLRIMNLIPVAPDDPSRKGIIIDMSSVSLVDPTALTELALAAKEAEKRNIRFVLADCNVKVYQDLDRCSYFFANFPRDHIFGTVPDAVRYVTEVDVAVPETRA